MSPHRALLAAAAAAAVLGATRAAAGHGAGPCSCPEPRADVTGLRPRVFVIVDGSGSISSKVWQSKIDPAIAAFERHARTLGVTSDVEVFWSEKPRIDAAVLEMVRYERAPRKPGEFSGRHSPIPLAITHVLDRIRGEIDARVRAPGAGRVDRCRPFWLVVITDGFPAYGPAGADGTHADMRWGELETAIDRFTGAASDASGTTDPRRLPIRFLLVNDKARPAPLLKRCPVKERQGNSRDCSSEFVRDGGSSSFESELAEAVTAAAISCDVQPPEVTAVVDAPDAPRSVTLSASDPSGVSRFAYAYRGRCTPAASVAETLTASVSGRPGESTTLTAFASDRLGNCSKKDVPLEWPPEPVVTTSLELPSRGASVCGTAVAFTGTVSSRDTGLPRNVVVRADRTELGRGPIRADGSFEVRANTRLVADGPTSLSVDPDPMPSVAVSGASVEVNVRNNRVRTPLDDVVALGREGVWHCSGVLVSPRHVLTAAHCLPASRVLFGDDVAHPARIEAVIASIRAPTGADLAVVTLARDVPVTARKLRTEPPPPAQPLELAHAGFGARSPDGSNEYGHKHFMWAPDTALACASSDCDPRWEFELAGGGGRDTCDGDSGGPVFERTRRPDGCPADEDPGQARLDWRLVGITSRARTGARQRCGEGGVYTRVDPFGDWIARTVTRATTGEDR